jgi:cell division protease FtsH
MATYFARSMVVNFGFSDKLGPLDFEAQSNDAMGSRQVSDHTAKIIDDEVKIIIDECYKKAHDLLEDNKDILEAMKNALVEYETIDSKQVDDLMARRKVRVPKDWHTPDKKAPSDPAGGVFVDVSKKPKDSGDSIGGPAVEL